MQTEFESNRNYSLASLVTNAFYALALFLRKKYFKAFLIVF